jgi:glutaredoxin 2
MTQPNQKAPRIVSMADKFCLNGHKGDWVARGGYDQGKAYCVSCAKEALARHKAKKVGIEGYKPTPRVRVATMETKQQAEERWARAVLTAAPGQVEMLQARLREVSEVVQEAHTVIKNTSDNDLLAFALERVRELSEVLNKVSK